MNKIYHIINIRDSRIKELIYICVILLLCTFWFTYPLINHIDSSFLSVKQNGDANQYIWNAYIFDKNFYSGNPLFQTDQLILSKPVNLWMHTYTPLMSTFCLLFENKILGVNLFLLLHFIIGGLGAYILSKKILQNQVAALLVAILFAYSPFKLLHLPQHYHLMLNGFAPWYILSFIKCFELFKNKYSDKLILQVSILLMLWLLNFFCDYYIAAFLVYFSGLYILFFFFKGKQLRLGWKKILLIWGLLLGIFHLLITQLYKIIDDKGGIYWGADLIDFILPNENTFILGRNQIVQHSQRLSQLLTSLEHQMYLGIIILSFIAAFIYILIRSRQYIQWNVWLFISIIFMMICIPTLKIVGYKMIYMPTAILHFIPFFNNIRCPTRILTLVHLFLPIALLYTLLPWLTTTLGKYKTNLIMVSLILFSFFDLKADTYTTIEINDVPTVVQKTKDSEGKTLLTLPTGVTDGMKKTGNFDVNQLYYQTIHQKQLVGGYISRLKTEDFDYFKTDMVMKYILELSESNNPKSVGFKKNELTNFQSKFHPDLLLIEKRYIQSEEQEVYIINATIGEQSVKTFEDKEWILYEKKP